MSDESATPPPSKSKLAALGSYLVANGQVLARDIVGVAGGLMIAHGVRAIYAPAGEIIAGGMVLVAALLIARAQAGEDK